MEKKIWHNIFFVFVLLINLYSFSNLNAKLEFANKYALFNLKTNNAKLKISSTNDIHGWQNQQIVSAPSDNTVFLYDNMIWGNDSGNFRVPNQSFEFTGNLTIPDTQVIKITEDIVIDGQGHSLTFGTTAQILIDSNVTLTLKNLTIKNNLSPISIPPIKCLDQQSKLVLENVKFALNDDFAFKTGQLYVHNDVIFTGSSKFIYQSVLPSYIQPHSTLYFDEQTTLDYAPNSTLKDLIVLQDETSSIYLNGATLQTTDTGIKLTKGKLIFDNKLTLSNSWKYSFTSLTATYSTDFITEAHSVDWSPDGNYLAVAGQNGSSDLIIYSWNELYLTQIDSKDFDTYARTVNWSPDGKYLAVGGNNLSKNLIIYSWDKNKLTELETKDFGASVIGVNWSPNGNYLAVAGNNGINDLILYSWNGSTLSQLDSKDFGNFAISSMWSPDGNHLAVSGNNGTTDIIIYSWDGFTLTVKDSKDFGTEAYPPSWSPDGNYLAVGGDNGTTDLIIYSWNGLSLTPTYSKDFGTLAISSAWSNNGHYLAVGGANGSTDLVIYLWNGSTLTKIDSKSFGSQARSLSWSPDNKYLAVAGNNGSSDLVIYRTNYNFIEQTQPFNNSIIFGDSSKGSDFNLNLSILGGCQGVINGSAWYDSTDSSTQGKLEFANIGSSIVLSNTNSQFKISNINNISGWKEESIVLASGNDNSWLPSTGITYGNLGPSTPPPARLLYHNSNAIINIHEDLSENSNAIVNNSNSIYTLDSFFDVTYDLAKENSNTIISFNELLDQNSNAISNHTDHFKTINNGKLYAVGAISGEMSIDGRAILSSPIDLNGATLNNGGDILFSSQTTVSSSGYLNPQGNAYILGGDLTIPSAVVLTFTSDGIIDGQGHSLTFGTTAQILIDTAVTVTLRNLTIKNDLNPISIPPIRCLDQKSKLVLENVKLALNDDFAFKTGQMYVHNDVIFTGSSKFIYQSVLPSYIQPHSTFYFDEQTTLDYAPSSTLKDLIVLSDESSSIYLNGATLQTTHTGIQLTKGRLLLENKVTLSSGANNIIYGLSYTGTPIAFSDRIEEADLDPSNRYLAFSGYSNNHPDLQIHYFDGNVLTGTPIAQKEVGFSIKDINWAPNGKHLTMAVNFPTGGDELQIYSFDNGNFNSTPVASRNYGTYTLASQWHPSGKYVTIGGQHPDSGAQLQIYSFDNNILSTNPIYSEVVLNRIETMKWSYDGNFLAVGGHDQSLTGSFKIYSFYDNTLSGTPIETRQYGASLNSVVYALDWSPDGNYLAVGGTTDGIAQVQIYSFYNNQLSASPVSEAHFDKWAQFFGLKWSPNGKYISMSGQYIWNNGNEMQIFKVDNGIISNNTITGIDYGWSSANTIWTADSKYLFCYGRLPNSGYELQQYEIKYMFDATEQTVSNAIILGDANKGSDYNLELSVLGGAQGIINGYAWYDSTNSSEKGKLDFANIGASLVLSDTNAQLKISNIENIVGWKEGSIVSTSGNNNTWLSSGINYGHLGPQNTPPPARLLYHNSNAIINIHEDLSENSNAIIDLEKFVVENSNAIVNSSEAILSSRINENSWAILNLKNDIFENSNSIVNNSNAIYTIDSFFDITYDLAKENSNTIISFNELLDQNSNAISNHTDHFKTINNGKLYAVGAISGEMSIDGRAILSSPIDLNGATLNNGGDILFSSQTTVSSSGYLNPQGNAYILGGDLTIPSAVVLTFTSDGIIDGQGHSLTFGTTAQILIDTAVTVTLRNLTIKNNLSPISIPPIRCLDWESKLVLENVKFALNDDFAFKTGQMYVHNDVIFTGSSKFIYQSVLPSYIQPHSTLYFDEQTTLDYAPSSTLKDLIVLSDESSSIYLNGATLQTTHTGIQLTKGRLLLENKVTLSSAANNIIYDITYTATPINFRDKITNGDLDQSNRYFAVGNWGGTPDLEIYYFDGNVLTGTPIEQREIGSSVNNTHWSPDCKNLAVSLSTPLSGDELQIYSFNNGSLSASAVDSKNYGSSLNSSNWHPSGKYLALGGYNPDSGAQLQIYSFDKNTLSTNHIYSETPFTTVRTVKWHPGGKFLVVAGNDSSSTGQLKIYSFYDNTLSGTPIESRTYGTATSSVYGIDWSPDGNYLAICGSSNGNAQTQIYSFYNNNLSPTPISEYHYGSLTEFFSIKWSPNGKYLSVTGRFIEASGNELIVFKVDYGIIASTAVTGSNFGFKAFGSAWTSDEKYLFVYGQAPDSGYELQQYEINYMFDTTQQTFNNSIIFGDSAKGSNYNLNSFVLGGARIEINGLAWFDDAN